MRYLLAIPLLLSACADPNAQNSAIVRRIEAAGSGDISSMTPPEIEQWFFRKGDPQLVASIAASCQQLEKSAAAGWDLRTAEGRSCMAAADANVAMPREFTSDGRKF